MPQLRVKISHKLSKEEARNRIRRLLLKLKSRFQGKISDDYETWQDDGATFGFKLMGMNLKGKINIENSSVDIDGSIPFSALPFKRTIEDVIRKEANSLLI